MTQQAQQDSGEYGLVNHVPSGEVYVMRWADGAVSGPLHYSEHLEALADAPGLDYNPENTEWAKGEEWQPHNETGNCQGCNP